MSRDAAAIAAVGQRAVDTLPAQEAIDLARELLSKFVYTADPTYREATRCALQRAVAELLRQERS